MKLNQENVFKFLETVSEKGATSKEILSALGQKSRKKAQLRKILKVLSRDKICFKNNNRYFLREPSEPTTPADHDPISKKRPLKKPRPIIRAESERKTRNKNHLLGKVIFENQGKSVYSFDFQKDFRLNKRDKEIYLHGDLVSFAIQKNRQSGEMATIVEMLRRRISCLRGDAHLEKKGRLVFFPDNKKGPRQYGVVNSVALGKNRQRKAWLDISKNTFHNRKPEGTVRLIDEENPQRSELLEEILATNNIPTRFPESVLKACQTLPQNVHFEAKDSRRDLRKYPFVTIDGEDAKDFDDAIYAEQEGENYRIWVSIADVAAYVPPGSVIDREAFSRGTSTYLPGIAYPMLPKALSNGICSLKEGVNRKTITCESVIDQKGKTLSFEVYPSFNKIACRLTYKKVDEFYETGQLKSRKIFPDLNQYLELYKTISRILRNRRIKAGFIDFCLPETKFVYDKEGQITDIFKIYQSVAMQVIEQFMLLANENVAKFCNRHKLPIIWRNHPPPQPDKLEKLKKLLWNNHIQVSSLKSGKDYNLLMKTIEDNPDKDFIETSMLRSMSLAIYETKRLGHFGIASEFYCHFTSPIRRYPDLMVHRALRNHFNGKKSYKIQEYIASTASDRERLATNAERSAVKFHKLWYMASYIGEIYEAKIVGMIHSGVFIEIEHPYVEGFVPFATIHDDLYEFDEDAVCIRGTRRKTRYTFGNKLQVLLTRLDWGNLSPEFDWICWRESV